MGRCDEGMVCERYGRGNGDVLMDSVGVIGVCTMVPCITGPTRVVSLLCLASPALLGWRKYGAEKP